MNWKCVVLELTIIFAVVNNGVAKVITKQNNLNIEEPKTTGEILQDIRNLMKDELVVGEPIHAYIIPSVDAHQSEYISERDQRITFVSGFTGSSGTVIITENAAALWTDSRYYLQAEEEIDEQYWLLMKSGLPDTPSTVTWLISTLPPNSRVGIDPYLMDWSEFSSLSNSLHSSGHTLVAIDKNIVDLAWTTRPEIVLPDIVPLDFKFSGKRVSDKIAALRSEIRKLNGESLVVNALDDVAWLLNLRGLDIDYNPVFFAYVIVSMDEIHLYMLNKSRITAEIYKHFEDESIDVIVEEYNLITNGIIKVLESTNKGKMILSRTSQAIYWTIPNDRRIVIFHSPVNMMKVIKNDIEAVGLVNAHKNDGIALTKYLHWLEVNVGNMTITEISGGDKLAEFRSQQENFRGLSFSSISAVGSHAAMNHFKPSEGNDRQITKDEVYLIDSGGQYWDGTTDVTRTVHFGTPNDEECEAFTRVLKGFIAINSAVFPSGAHMSFFDAMARRFLWEVGWDYGHGSGHGVGSYLSVHEYPPSIATTNTAPGMVKNMFTSNEPGYYEDGQFGVRIEDVIQVVEANPSQGDFNGRGALKFIDITMAPIQKKMIKVELLTKNEVTWFNDFHRRVLETIGPELNDKDAYEWLVEQTKPLEFMCKQ